MNSQSDFLHIPDGEAVTMILKFSTGMERTGRFGRYFIYGVIHEGKDKLLKATERLEKQLRKAGVHAGQEIELRKDSVTPKQGETYSVINLVPGNEFQETVCPAAVQSGTGSAASADELRMLSDALSDARTICKYANEPSIIPEITLAVGLFLARTMRMTMQTNSVHQKKADGSHAELQSPQKKKTSRPSGILRRKMTCRSSPSGDDQHPFLEGTRSTKVSRPCLSIHF